MSERLDLDNIPNLDAQTLRWAAELVREEGYRSRECLLQYAMNEEARKPDLVDWISALCRSRLGAPSSVSANAFGITMAWSTSWPPVTAGIVVDNGRVEGGFANGGPCEYATPIGLRIALNLIADVKGGSDD